MKLIVSKTISTTLKKRSHTSKIEKFKQKKRYKNFRSLNTILESVDTMVTIAVTSFSRILSITGIGLVILPISAGIACFFFLD